jgi:hypothetical protein
MEARRNVQTAPYPEELAWLVAELTYRPGWSFKLSDVTDRDTASEEASGLTLLVYTVGYDTYHPENGQTYRVAHHFPVPAATYNEQSWRRWLLDCVIKVETHEACEFFQIDGERPYAPQHGPGNDPYIIFEHGSDVERRTSFRGEVKEDPRGRGPCG